jgi:hypothetical protein
MKTKIFIATFLTIAFFGCWEDRFVDYYDYDPPTIPTDITVINGDNRVDIYWAENRERDLAGYNIYYSYSYNGKYYLLGSSSDAYYIDYGASNGEKYYYAVTAYDYNGNESELSMDVIYATPRPEGFNQSIFDYRKFPSTSGYDFSKYMVLPYDNQSTDFFFENFNGTYYLVVWEDTDIKDMGPTIDIYDIPFAPTSGWSSTKDEIVKVGHTYVIWTWDNHFAKIRIKNVTPDRIVFDWAYQTVQGNNQLKPLKENNERKPIEKKIPRIDGTSKLF